MKSIVINGKTRSVFGKKEANKKRKHDEIPCVLYGGKETLHFHLKNDQKPYLDVGRKHKFCYLSYIIPPWYNC